MARSTADRLAAYQRPLPRTRRAHRRHRVHHRRQHHPRHNRCGKPTCHCHADPPQPHGPYWQWTAKINGKTVTRRLTETEAQLYQQWIANDRQLRALIDQMRQVAAKATELILKEAGPRRPRFNRKLRASTSAELPVTA